MGAALIVLDSLDCLVWDCLCGNCVYALMIVVDCLHVAYLLNFAFGGLLGFGICGLAVFVWGVACGTLRFGLINSVVLTVSLRMWFCVCEFVDL